MPVDQTASPKLWQHDSVGSGLSVESGSGNMYFDNLLKVVHSILLGLMIQREKVK
jgi:hypothetical protein